MKKILFTFILLLSCDILLSQEQEQPNYFPLAIGNRWEYVWTPDPNSLYCVIMDIEVTRDTTMSNGKKYFIIEKDSNTLGYHHPMFCWFDPLRMDEKRDIYRYDTITNSECLYYLFSDSATYSQCFYYSFSTPRQLSFTSKTASNAFIHINIDSIRLIYCVSIYPGYLAFVNNVGLMSIAGEEWLRSSFVLLLRSVIDGKEVYKHRDYSRLREMGERWTFDNGNPTITLPTDVKLHQNYPNPFNPETRIDFEIPKTEKVKLVIYNTLGNEVKTLLNDELQAGKYSTIWNGKDNMNNKVSSGIYFYQLTFGNNMQSITKKLIFLK